MAVNAAKLKRWRGYKCKSTEFKGRAGNGANLGGMGNRCGKGVKVDIKGFNRFVGYDSPL